jgi:molybdopterin molybdotransferase
MLTAFLTRDMLGRTGIVPVAAALALLEKHLPPGPLGSEDVDLRQALGRILFEEVRSPEELPPHPRSTMDGYAVRAADTFGASERLPAYLEISGEVAMGSLPAQGPRGGTCFRIATGGLLPPGADAVVMFEHTVSVDSGLIEVTRPVAAGGNVIAAGEDVRTGEVLLGAAHRLRPQDLGLLAGLGIGRLRVCRRVRVGVLSTGDELVAPEEEPPPGKIRDMNGITLQAMADELGCLSTHYGIAPDEEGPFRELAARAHAENDLILFSGSSSVGARDLGEQILASLGEPGIVVHGVAMKPGKPVIIAFAGDKPLFGLPGHPVSASVAFELFVRPAIARLAGGRLRERRTVAARLMRNVNSAAGRLDVLRVRLDFPEGTGCAEACPVLGKSGALSSLVKAHGFVIVDEHRQGLHQGEMVEVKLFE